MTCPHDIIERDIAISADGYCPLCLAAENAKLIERLHKVTQIRMELSESQAKLRAALEEIGTISAQHAAPTVAERMLDRINDICAALEETK